MVKILMSMDSMQFTIFTFVIVVLIAVVLYWIYLDHSDKAELRSNSGNNNVVKTSHNNQIPKERKSTGWAAVLSFFYSGLGQIYNGQILKGIAILILQSILIVITLLSIAFSPFAYLGAALNPQGAVPFGDVTAAISLWVLILIVLNVIVKVYSIYDAYKTAKKTWEE